MKAIRVFQDGMLAVTADGSAHPIDIVDTVLMAKS